MGSGTVTPIRSGPQPKKITASKGGPDSKNCRLVYGSGRRFLRESTLQKRFASPALIGSIKNLCPLLQQYITLSASRNFHFPSSLGISIRDAVISSDSQTAQRFGRIMPARLSLAIYFLIVTVSIV